MNIEKAYSSKVIQLIVLFFFVLTQFLNAQEGTYYIPWISNGIDQQLKNSGNLPNEFLRLKYMNEASYQFPFYNVSLKTVSKERKYEITNLNFETISDSLINKILLPDILPGFNPVLESFKAGRDEEYINISIPSVRFNENSGKYEKLICFDIVSSAKASLAREINEQKVKSINSQLVSGNWYKIKVNETGIYKLTYSDIIGMGFTNPANIRVYGNGGKQLSFAPSSPRPDDLNEIPIHMSKGDDGIFNEGDFILFYAEGPVAWTIRNWPSEPGVQYFREKIHGYSDFIFYFLTTSKGPATQIPTRDNRALEANVSVNSYNSYAYYEKEKMNLIQSGRTWYSCEFDGNSFDTVFTLPDHINGEEVLIEALTASRSLTSRYSFLKIDGYVVDTVFYSPTSFTYDYSIFAMPGNFYYSFPLNSESFTLGMEYIESDAYSDRAFINSITINSRSRLNFSGNHFLFRDINSVGAGNIAGFTITNVPANFQVWDISNINSITSLAGNLSGSDFYFIDFADSLHEYLVLDLNAEYPKPVISDSEDGVGKVLNQNLHGLPASNYIIVAPDVFLEQAERLADFHRSKKELSVLVVTPELIYNEFSSGTPDVSAIRDFFRHMYLKDNGSNRLRYSLLFGDGSYDNRSKDPGNTDYILTYQAEESLNPSTSFVSDDFFGLLDDDNASKELEGKMDIGIGRLTVKLNDGNDYEAEDVVDKIIAYDTCMMSDWRRTLCFVADDGFDPPSTVNTHQFMSSSELFSNYTEQNHPGFEFKKLYLDAYPQINTSTGSTYPEVNRELNDLFNKGMLVMNYFGHGNVNQITAERILANQDVLALRNKLMPLIITGSCSVSKYDVVEIDNNSGKLISRTSMGENALLNPEGGAIALLSTTRVVDQYGNEELVSRVFEYLFRRFEDGSPYRLGDIVMKAKNDIGDNRNKHNFSLLGDPALVLAYPKYLVCTDSINHVSVNDVLDTLKAFEKVTVSGYIAYSDSNIIQDFNGLVYPHVYDKKQHITTFGNDNIEPFEFDYQKNLIYKGKANVINGRFSFSFYIPKDISYNYDFGKISYYAENGVIDAGGEFRGVLIGGTSINETDDRGPEISLYMNDERFSDGGMTNKDPYIHAVLFDEHGLNTTGAGIGHDIIGVLDGDINPLILNDYYEALTDSYQEGLVRYQLKDLEEGEHELYIKAWDIYNNSSEKSITFVVEGSDGLVLEKVISFPNPTDNFTWFQYTHNSPDEVHEVVLEVFDISGRLITRIEQKQIETGFVSAPIYWDLRTSTGQKLNPGVYPYRLKITTPIGSAFIDQKLIILK